LEAAVQLLPVVAILTTTLFCKVLNDSEVFDAEIVGLIVATTGSLFLQDKIANARIIAMGIIFFMGVKCLNKDNKRELIN
jgi:hypothetical protein